MGHPWSQDRSERLRQQRAKVSAWYRRLYLIECLAKKRAEAKAAREQESEAPQ